MSLKNVAQHLAEQGRGNDSTLVHMSSKEVKSLQNLAKAHGGSLSINPSTGLPEAGFLDSLLPTIIGAGLTAATGGAAAPLIGLGIGGIQAMRTGDLGKGLMAGLGAYGGAGLMSGFMGSGAEAAAEAATEGLTEPAAIQAARAKAIADAQASPWTTAWKGAKNVWDKPNSLEYLGANMSTGFGASPLKKLGITAAAAAAPTIYSAMQQSSAAPSPSDAFKPSQVPVYSYSSRPTGATANVPRPVDYRRFVASRDVSPQSRNFGVEQQYFYPEYTQTGTATYADGGTTDEAADLASIGANLNYPMSGIVPTNYSSSWHSPIAKNMLTSAADVGVNARGEMNFADGGLTYNPATQTYEQASKPTNTGMYGSPVGSSFIYDPYGGVMYNPSSRLYYAPTGVFNTYSDYEAATPGVLAFNRNKFRKEQDADAPPLGPPPNDLPPPPPAVLTDEENQQMINDLESQTQDAIAAGTVGIGDVVSPGSMGFGIEGGSSNAPSAGPGPGDPSVSGANSESSHSADGNNSGDGSPSEAKGGIIRGISHFADGGSANSQFKYDPASESYVIASQTNAYNDAPVGSAYIYDPFGGVVFSPSDKKYYAQNGIYNSYSDYEASNPGVLKFNRNKFKKEQDADAPALGDEDESEGQGVSNSAISLGLGLMSYGDKLGGMLPGGFLAGLIGRSIVDQQLDNLGKVVDFLNTRDPNQVVVSDQSGNVHTVGYSPAGTVGTAVNDDTTAGIVGAGATDATGYSPAGTVGTATNDGTTAGVVSAGAADASAPSDGGDGDYRRGGEIHGISHLGDYSDGGRLLRGPGDGVSDDIPAMIGKKQPARLADGEFVVPARIVSELGNGSTEAGARKLYAMMDRIQSNRKKTMGKGKQFAKDSKADRYLPA